MNETYVIQRRQGQVWRDVLDFTEEGEARESLRVLRGIHFDTPYQLIERHQRVLEAELVAA